jgi:hypothetical protein
MSAFSFSQRAELLIGAGLGSRRDERRPARVPRRRLGVRVGNARLREEKHRSGQLSKADRCAVTMQRYPAGPPREIREPEGVGRCDFARLPRPTPTIRGTVE